MRDRPRRAVAVSMSVVLGCSILLANAVEGAVRRVSPEAARAAARESRLPSRPAAPLFAPGQLLVRFADSVLSPAEVVFDRQASFAEHTLDRSSGLDELFRRFGVRGVHPIVREPVRAVGAVPAAKDLRAADEAAQSAQLLRFGLRAARAPRAAAPPLHHLYRLDLAPGADVLAAAAAFAADPHVDFAEPNAVHEVALLPNDPFADPDGDGLWQAGSWSQSHADLWGLEAIGWREVWENQARLWPNAAQRGGKGVVVAVIDTGVDVGHEDLAENVWRDRAGRPGLDTVDIVTAEYVAVGWELDPTEDYTTLDFDPVDRHGHGTHVAGTIAAVANNGRGIAGVAWASRVMPVRAGFQVLAGGERFGFFETDDIIRALDRAVAAGADVINMSFGGTRESRAFETAIARASRAGVVLVAAAGNSNIDTRFFLPAAYEGVVAVAALNPGGRKASFSNWGRTIEVAAPGEDVLSLRARDTLLTDESQVVAGQYVRASGTSMASPHVAGVAALLVSAFPRARTPEIVSRLVAGALSREPVEPVSDGRFRWALGGGRLDAVRSLTLGPGTAVYLAGEGIGQDASADGAIDPGETGALQIVLRNAWRPLRRVRIAVSSLDPFATVTTGAQVRDLPQGGDLVVNFSFVAAAPLRWGQANRFRVVLDARGGFHREFPVELTLRGPRFKRRWPALAATEHDLSYFAPALADLDGDSRADVVATTYTGDVLALRADGSPVPGWPVHLRPPSNNGGINVADLDGDSRPEVVVSHGNSLSVLEPDGSPRPGWPVAFDTVLHESAALGDLNGDGTLEIVVVEQEGTVHVLDAGGRARSGWPRLVGDGRTLAAPLLVDLDGGGLDVVVAVYGRSGLFAFHADGSPVAGWPAAGASYIGRAIATSDLDGDGRPEIIALTYFGEVLVVDARGRIRVHTPPLFEFALSSPAVGDLDGDGRPEIVVGGDYGTDRGALYAFTADGTVLPGWPVRTGAWVRTSPALVDFDGDGALEVVAGSLDGWLHALRADGRPVPGWPYFLGHIPSDNLALGDMDGDGALDIVTTLSRVFTSGYQPIAGVVEFGEVPPGPMPWPSGRGGPRNPGAAAGLLP